MVNLLNKIKKDTNINSTPENIAHMPKANIPKNNYSSQRNNEKLTQKQAKLEEQKRLQAKKKQLLELQKRRKPKSKVPKSTQDTIPYIADYDNGIFEIAEGRFSIVFTFDDVNYQISRREEQEAMFFRFGEFLNYFSPEVECQIVINNRNVDLNQLKESILIDEEVGDGIDEYRAEYNDMLMKQVSGGRNDLECDKYIVVTMSSPNIMEATMRFDHMEYEIIANMQKIGSRARRLTTEERLEILHDIFRPNEVGNFSYEGSFSYDYIKAQKLSTKDFICPASFRFDKNDFHIGDRWARCLFINNLPTFVSDKFLAEITDCTFNMVTNLAIKAVAPEEALKIVKHQILGMEANKIEQQKKAMRAGYDPSMINHNLKHSLDEAEELLDDLQSKNQKMFLVSIVIMHMADTKEKLEADTESLNATARKYLCQVQKLSFQQEEAFRQVLPLGWNTLPIQRTLTTESTAIFIPFTSKELFQKHNGMYYGLNGVSKNLIMFSRKSLKNPNGFILGTPGSGKSFSAKRELINVLLTTGDDVIIIDPEREYTSLAEGFGGSIIHISAASKHHINPFDMNEDYAGDDNPLILKSELILSFCEVLIGGRNGLTPIEKSVIDRCMNLCYTKYMATSKSEDLPTLKEFYAKVLEQPEVEAKQVASALEMFTTGSLSVFSHQTNVDINNRFTIFDIKDLGKNLKTIGLLVALDTIWNRITANRAKGIRTWFYIDEIYLLFSNEYSANYLFELWKRARKWGAIPTGITQNVEDLLKSDTARTMLANSEFLYLLNQAHSDRMELAKMLNISDAQLGFVKDVEAGQGLIRAGVNIVPFVDKFPADTQLYNMMTTNPDEIAKIQQQKELAKQQEQEKLRLKKALEEIDEWDEVQL